MLPETPLSWPAVAPMLLSLSLGACGGGSGGPGIATTPPPPTTGLFRDATLNVAGVMRFYDYYVPAGLPAQNAPTVILLHGGTGNKSLVLNGISATSEWRNIADDEGVLLVVPNGADSAGDTDADSANWNDCRADETIGSLEDDVALISALIDWAAADYDIDTARVYVSGASNGGMMSYRAAMELGGRIAGIAAFIANNPGNSECTPLNQPVPTFICNGTNDALMPWNGGNVGLGTNRGIVDSAMQTLAFWTAYNGSTTQEPAVIYPDLDTADGSTVSSIRYVGATEVIFYTVAGGGHAVPSIDFQSGAASNQNHDIEAVRQAWDFLKSQP